MSNRWSRNLRFLALLFVIAATLWLVIAAQALIGPLAIAAMLAYVLNPLVDVVNRSTKLPRRAVVPLFYLVAIAVLITVGIVFAPAFATQASILSMELRTVAAQVQTALAERIVVLGFSISTEQIMGEFDSFSETFVRSDRIVQAIQAATTNLVWMLVILVTTYYLLQDWNRFREWLFAQLPEAFAPDARRLYQEVKDIWQAYLRGQLVLMFLMGLLTGIALAAIGLPGAAAIGLVTGVLDIVPTLGPTLAMIAAGIIAWFEGSSFLPLSNLWFTLLVLIVHSLVQGIENVWLRPRILGRQIKMHPAVVFLGIVGALTLVGVVGALVVVPMLGTIGVVGGYLRRRILGLDPWPGTKEED